MSNMYINYDGVESYATTIAKRNETLLQELHNIQEHIKSLAGRVGKRFRRAIREKITGMEPRFQQYYDIVDNYVKCFGTPYRTTGELRAPIRRTRISSSNEKEIL